MSKPRSDSKLKLLPPERQEQIYAWCNTPKTEEQPGGYDLALQQLAADGIRTSVGALSDFWSWYSLKRTFEEANTDVDNVMELVRAEFPDVSADKIAAVGQMLFTTRAVKLQNSEEFREMEKLRLSKDSAKKRAQVEDKKLDLAERRVKVAERKLDQLKGTLTDGSLNAAEKEQRMKAVFGLA
jgi:hypothetical protein